MQVIQDLCGDGGGPGRALVAAVDGVVEDVGLGGDGGGDVAGDGGGEDGEVGAEAEVFAEGCGELVFVGEVAVRLGWWLVEGGGQMRWEDVRR